MPVGGSGSGGPRAGDVRAGGAFVEVSLRDKLSQSLAGLKKKFEAFAKLSGKLGIGLFGAGATGAAAVGKLFGEALDRGKDFQNLAERFGTTTEKLSALSYAFEAAGVPVEQFGDAIKGLEKKLSTAADGQDETFRRLGLNARALMGLPLDEQMGAIADAIAAVSDPADQARIAMELFEESGLKLLPMLKKGRAGLAEMGEEAKQVGAILDGDTAKKSQEASRAFNRGWLSIKYAALEVGAAILENTDSIKDAARWVVNIARTSREWIAENKGLVTTVALVTAGTAAAGAALIAFGIAASGVAAGIGAGIAIVKGLVAGFALLLSPVGLATAAVAAFIALWVTQTDSGAAWLQNFGEELSAFGERAKAVLGGIGAALREGDLRTAGKIALLGLETEFARFIARAMPMWNQFKGFFVNAWQNATDSIARGLVDALAFIETMILGVGQSIRKNIGDSFTSVLKEMIGKYIDFMEATNLLGVNSVQIAGARKLLEGLELSPDDAKAKQDAIEEERKRRRAQIDKDAADAKDKRNKDNAKGEGDANDFLKRLEQELADLINNAKDKAKPPAAPEAKPPAKLPGLASLTADVKGGFATPLLARQFGIGDTVAKRALAAAEKQVRIQEKELPKVNAGIRDIAAGLTFK